MNDELKELLPEFIAEATDVLEKAHRDLDSFLGSSKQVELLDSITRSIHTIKGGCAMFNYNATKEAAHQLESFLLAAKEKPSDLNETHIGRIRREIEQIEKLLKSGEKPPGAELNPKNATSSESAKEPTTPVGDDFIRVPVNRMNDTLNAISEVFLIRNQMVYLVERYKGATLDRKDFLQNWELLDGAMRRGIGDLERTAMSMRMMTVQGLFSRMGRVVQTYTGESGKKIQFLTTGESTELDKKIMDTLGEPLIHLIRNAMDHGIERPEERLAKGKPEIGTIHLQASLSGNEAILKIEDDGKGIDPAHLLTIAKAKGIDTSQITDDKSVVDLIFLPGFSTAEMVSDVSGRGVGMDAVKTSVQSLGGRISTFTEKDKGTTFTIRLPVSMSLISSILVDINGLKYAIPNYEVLESRQIPLTELKLNGGKSYFSFRNHFAVCMDLCSLLQSTQSKSTEYSKSASIILFNTESGYVAARVSRLERNTEIIVKPTSKLSAQLPFVTGVSVLPTGEPIFVLSLLRLWEHQSQSKQDNSNLEVAYARAA